MMIYTIDCPKCEKKTSLKNALDYEGKTIRFSCKNESCGEQIVHTVHVPKPDSTLIVESENGLGGAARLLVASSEFNQEVALILVEGRQRIGRKSPNKKIELSITSTDISMSRAHCLIIGYKTKSSHILYTIQDLESRNKIFINSTLVNSLEEHYLSPGDIIKLGNTEMRFEYI